MTALTTSTTVTTEHASKYLQQLCKHFAHKVSASYNAQKGEVTFPFGSCQMEAEGDVLTIHCQAQSDEELLQTKAVIESHLERFAWKEELKLTWPAR